MALDNTVHLSYLFLHKVSHEEVVDFYIIIQQQKYLWKLGRWVGGGDVGEVGTTLSVSVAERRESW